jgi:hypothetical protein
MITLDGQFKVDIYNQQDELLSGSDYFGNFITMTGLNYPLTMPFAACFKYLSVGSGNLANTMFTTGLEKSMFPYIYTLPPFSDSNRKENFMWMTGLIPGGCGFTTDHTADGGIVELHRAWRLPELNGTYMDEDMHVRECMTSPATTGGLGERTTDYPPHFTDDLSGITAFSRVLKDFTIPSGDYGVISYKLTFTVDSSVRDFDPFVGLVTAQGVDSIRWQYLTGQARILHPGIQVVAGEGTKLEEGEEGGYGGGEDSKVVAGDAVMLDYGEPLEPSSTGNFWAYFSTDDTQYLYDYYYGGKAKPNIYRLTHGKMQGVASDNTLHWNTTGIYVATGFPDFYYDLPDALTKEPDEAGGGGEPPPPTTPNELRTGVKRLERFKKYRRIGSICPNPDDAVGEIELAGITAQNGQVPPFCVTSLNHSSDIFYTGAIDTDRDRHLTRTLSWTAINAQQDPSSPGTYIPYKSLVFGGAKGDGVGENMDSLYPFFDALFGSYDPTNHPAGGEFLPTFNTGTWPYNTIANKPKFTESTKDYPYPDNQNGLDITWKLTWSAPCGGVAGFCDDDQYLTKGNCQGASQTWTDCVDP